MACSSRLANCRPLARYGLPLAALLVGGAWLSPLLSPLITPLLPRLGPLLPASASLLGSLLLIALVLRLQNVERQLRLQLSQEASVRGIYKAIASGQPLADTLNLIAHSIEQESPGALASILLLDPSTRQLRLGAAPSLPEAFNQAVDGLPAGEGNGTCGTSAFRGEPVIVEDIAQHPYWARYQHLSQLADVAACWSQPILATDGAVLGTLAIYHRTPCAPSAEALRQIEQTAALAAIAIEPTLKNEALKLADSVFRNSSEAIVVTDARNQIQAVNPAFTRLTGYTLAEVRGRTPALLGSGRMDRDFFSRMWAALDSQGHWEGEIWNKRKSGEVFAEHLKIEVARHADGSVANYVGIFSDLTDAKKVEELIWQQANFDHLTGLANRRLFRDRLQQEMRHAEHRHALLGLLLIDLDSFREINASLGQDCGDTLLVQVAQRIASCLGDDDSAARLGSDEFTVILPSATDPASIERLVQHLLRELARPYSLNGATAFCSASIGISLYPENGRSDEELLKSADQALNAARSLGRGHFAWCTPELQYAAQVRAALIHDLHSALDSRQMRVHYQPIVDLSNDKITKVEALLRWQHPERGWIDPSTFIPLAEEVGLIGELGDWVFRTVAAQASEWQKKGIQLQYGVNKSPQQFNSNECNESWLSILAAAGVPPECIVIEITEGLLLEQNETVAARLDMFRAAGVKIAIDDFGTGYSSLSYLQRFDIDYLKIDRSFISELAHSDNSRALTDAVIVMAHKLGIELIAEGVETSVQSDWLQAASCDFGQGFLWARALPADELEPLLRTAPQ